VGPSGGLEEDSGGGCIGRLEMAVFGGCVFRQPDIVLVALELAFFV
jgi:hypothetical protein